MQIESRFSVPLSQEQTWDSLLDFERVASAMPGARLDGVDGSDVKGAVTIKLGPMKLEYKGTARVETEDPNRRELRIIAEGREARGSGSASASILALLLPSGAGTEVEIVVDIDITGRPAQMGASLVRDVAQRLTDEFAENLRNGLIEDTSTSGLAPQVDVDAADLDMLKLASGPIARRAVVIVAIVTGLWVLWKVLR